MGARGRKVVGLAGCLWLLAGCASARSAKAESSSTPVPVTGTLPLSINQPPASPATPGVTDPPRGAVRLSLTSKDVAQIVQAYETWTMFPGHCNVSPIPGTLKAGTVEKSGMSWAFGQFKAPAGCMAGPPEDPVALSDAFSPGPPLDSGVFERLPGAAWAMNSYETVPFPCPDNLLRPETTPVGRDPHGIRLRHIGATCYTAEGIARAAGAFLTQRITCQRPYRPGRRGWLGRSDCLVETASRFSYLL